MLTECGKWWIAVAPLDLDDALECPYCCKQHGIFADELMEIRNGGGDDGDGLPLERSA